MPIRKLEEQVAELEAEVSALGLKKLQWENKQTRLKEEDSTETRARAERMTKEKDELKEQISSFETFLAQE